MNEIIEKVLLQQGDTLYEYGNYGIYDKVTVTRVTPTQAILSNGKKVGRVACLPFRPKGYEFL